MDIRTFGVEEEFLLVEPNGRPRALIEHVLAGLDSGLDGEAEHELKQEQAETASSPHHDLGALQADLLGRRRNLAAAVTASGGALCAMATSPFAVDPTATQDERYDQMMREYGLTAAEQLTCGCHVHVSIGSKAEGIAALNGITPWLPVLTALSVNSAFSQGVDTGYASYRRMMWDRWPSSGPTQHFSSEQEYDEAVSVLTRTGVLLDEGMVYFDARLSRRYPTVEIRVADVCAEVADAVLIAALCRGLVETAISDRDEAGPQPRVDLVRGAAWRAARSGMSGELIDVIDRQTVPAWSLAQRLADHVSPALKRSGDLDDVEASLERLHRRGTGADLQRASFARRGDLADVVADAVERTVS